MVSQPFLMEFLGFLHFPKFISQFGGQTECTDLGNFEHRELRARYGKAYSANQPRSQALSPLSPLYEEKEAMRYGWQRRESLT